MPFTRSPRRVLSICLLSAVAMAGAARADDDDGVKFSNPAMQTYAALAKIESNLGESAAKLYLRAALPAKHDERDDLAEGYADDVKTIESSVKQIDAAGLAGDAAKEFAEFKSGWAAAKALSEGLMSASAETPAKPEALTAHAKAYDDLDEAIDEALEAVAKEAKS